MPKLSIPFPTNKAEAKHLLTQALDRLDGEDDDKFDGKAFAKLLYGNTTDDLKENAFVAFGAIAFWEVGKLVARLFGWL